MPDGYTAAAGALAAGNDVHSGQFTLAEAKAYCNSTETCTGFTLHVPLSAVRPDESYHVFFKGARATNSDQAWTAFFKVRLVSKDQARRALSLPLEIVFMSVLRRRPLLARVLPRLKRELCL
jgi:hypothetical protein